MHFTSANRRVHAVVQQLMSEGADSGALANILLAYALSLEFDARGSDHVAEHLKRLSERFDAGRGKTFNEIAGVRAETADTNRNAVLRSPTESHSRAA